MPGIDDQSEIMRVMEFKVRIAEVLKKYNVQLPDAPLSALAMAMERMVGNRVRTWKDVFPDIPVKEIEP